MSQPLNPVLNSHRKFLEFANDHRPYVVVKLDDTSEPTPIAGYSDPAFAINACNELEDTMHTPHVVYHLRQDELGWHCDYQNRSVTNDVENVLRKIEHYHQGSIAACKIMYRDSEGMWDGIQWDGKRASFFALRETVEERAHNKLLDRKRSSGVSVRASHLVLEMHFIRLQDVSV
jgi:hypothetical protein